MSEYVRTPNLGLYKPLDGGDENLWGGHLNLNADILDSTFGGSFLPLSGGVVTGPTTFLSNVVVGSGVTNAGIAGGYTVPLLDLVTNLTGAMTGPGYFGLNRIDVPNDTAAVIGSGGVLNDLYITHRAGGAGFAGNRQGLSVSMMQSGPITTPSVLSGIAVGVTLSDTFGGTPSVPAGAAACLNPYLTFASGYTNGEGGGGMEVDVSGRAGSSFADKLGIIVVLDSLDAVQGTATDAALVFGNQTEQGAGRGWKSLIQTGAHNGFFGVATDGVFWSLKPHSSGSGMRADKGLAWGNGVFATSAIETPGFRVDGAGEVYSPNAHVGTTIFLGTSVATGGDCAIATPNGSNIKLVPQGSGNVVAQTTGSGQFQTTGPVIFGGGNGNVSGAEVGLSKMSASGTAPGSGVAKLAVVPGSTAGTAKLIMYAGLSNTPVTIVDNIGAGF